MELLESNPFPDKPPVYMRALYYDYIMAAPRIKKMEFGGTGSC
jgi:hypothetical protein